MTLAEKLLRQIFESEECVVDQKWCVTYCKYDYDGKETDKMIVSAPNEESAGEIVKRMIGNVNIKSVNKSKKVEDADDDDDVNTLLGLY